MRIATLTLLASCIVLAGCPHDVPEPDWTDPDPHSFSRPAEIAVEHLALDVAVDFERRTIEGRASLRIVHETDASELWLDTRDLDIHGVRLDDADDPAKFRLGDDEPFLGRPLIVEILPGTRVVHVDYASRPAAAALQWLEPSQTSGGEHPFLLSQSQSIFARTWIPCQDSPGVRMTYDATVRVPPGLMAVMSAENPTETSPDGTYSFRMPQPIPSYLLALAVGDLAFHPLGPRSGVYAEPSVIARAAWEFAGTEPMIDAAVELYGPYRWGRYDLVVLPASFPFGGMENPRLTFVTPTLLAGDRSLVSTVAHELAHSWSGNLVTNATWNDFWLNEGFTVYFENRIMERIHGREYSEMLAMLGQWDLEGSFAEVGEASADTHLYLDLEGRDPDESGTYIAYEKGYLFLRMLEEHVGREAWDRFVRDYFDRFAFRSMTTARFLGLLGDELIPEAAERESLKIHDWVFGPGLPENAPTIQSAAFVEVDGQLERWIDGTAARDLDTADWTTHQWLRFVRGIPEGSDVERLAELDGEFGFSASGNAEILHSWLLQAVAHDYEPAYDSLERFVSGMGRNRFLQPLYAALSRTPEGLERARRIYRAARGRYHPLSTAAVDPILGWPWD